MKTIIFILALIATIFMIGLSVNAITINQQPTFVSPLPSNTETR